jgi:hypothetical protein
MADSCVTCTETLGQSTKRKALCKRRRSSEVALAFLQEFHCLPASCCQCCLWGPSALLKACESFKEKLPFCCRISAAMKNKSGKESRSRLSDLCLTPVAPRYRQCIPPVQPDMRVLLRAVESWRTFDSLCRESYAYSSRSVCSRHISNGTYLLPPRLPLLRLLL